MTSLLLTLLVSGGLFVALLVFSLALAGLADVLRTLLVGERYA